MSIVSPGVKLNAAQESAATHGVVRGSATTCDPLLIIAGAGTGKTNTLAHRAANLMACGVPANRMLLLTFTRNAATEMSARIHGILPATPGAASSKMPWAGTFHSVGLRLLKLHGGGAGLEKRFTILDQDDAVALMTGAALGCDTKSTTLPTPAEALAIYSFGVNARLPTDVVLSQRYPGWTDQLADLQRLFQRYVKDKRSSNVVDFDDLLLLWLQLFERPKTARALRQMFDHILVDEYQDTNALQAEILKRLTPDGCGLTVVGDDAQAIYSFRAADVRNILDFRAQYGPKAKIIKLEENYRSTSAILDASNAVIDLASARFDKTLRANSNDGAKPRLVTVADESEQTRYVIKVLLANQRAGISLDQQVVLFRSARDCADLERELVKLNIPYVKSGGQTLVDAKFIKDATAVVRWASNSRDVVAAHRVLELMPGIGPATAGKLIKKVRDRRLYRYLKAFAPPAMATKQWPEFVKLMRALRSSKAAWPKQMVDVHVWCASLRTKPEDGGQRFDQDAATLAALTSGFKSRRKFLEAVAVEPSDAMTSGNGTASAGRLTISTIHSAKGREFEAVFVLNAVEGCVPSARSREDTDLIEEERRLLYVAMTRAKRQLTLLLPQEISGWPGTADYGAVTRTRFIPANILHHFKHTTQVAKRRGLTLTFLE